ncbi:UPF0443 protein C11orf75-like [Scleropages formosus]|uniref:Single-pass membrane and coiled-coil domain-containing protein 4 n=2 Tax=Scleropages formosus TaxID=113540 RepID=A0A0P7WDN9_SCLFO|nr:UPF0443 protein C11orf75-like [Scleropages formosus]
MMCFRCSDTQSQVRDVFAFQLQITQDLVVKAGVSWRDVTPAVAKRPSGGKCGQPEQGGDAASVQEAAMRQLKGKPKKETSKDKKERKQAMQEARQQIATVVLPTLAVVVLLIVVFVYVATRPGALE